MYVYVSYEFVYEFIECVYVGMCGTVSVYCNFGTSKSIKTLFKDELYKSHRAEKASLKNLVGPKNGKPNILYFEYRDYITI